MQTALTKLWSLTRHAARHLSDIIVPLAPVDCRKYEPMAWLASNHEAHRWAYFIRGVIGHMGSGGYVRSSDKH